jgi:transposase-like protein
MRSKTRRTFSPEFRLESAQLVVDHNHSMREAALAVGVGNSTSLIHYTISLTAPPSMPRYL